MYAIIQTGGKQYWVEQGDVIEVELLEESSGPVEFKEILFLSDGNEIKIGTPHLTSCLVKGEVMGLEKAPKVFSFKYKRRKNCRKKIGHRQKYAKVKITEIVKK